MSIEQLLSFTKFLNQFREVERSIYYSDSPRRENDAEHCWQISMLAWYIIQQKSLPLSLEKVFQYCVIHDIAEMYAGDVCALKRSDEKQILKEQKEHEAMERIYKEFPEAHPLWKRLEEYEKREDDESKFVYALDKVLPVMNIYNDWWYWRKDNNISLENDLLPPKEQKVQLSDVVKEIWDEMVMLLREHKSEMFVEE